MRRTLIALISACLSYSLAVSATGDARDFPASWCRDNVYNASGNLGIEPAGVYSLTPEASDSDFAICPIFLHRDSSATSPTYPMYAKVFVDDRSALEDFDCRLQERLATGGTFFGSTVSSSGIEAVSLTLPTQSIFAGSSAVVFCEVPGVTTTNVLSFLRWYRAFQDEF